MKKIIIGLLLIVLSTTGAWAMSYDEASKLDKPIILYINMFGCSACKHFDVFFQQAESKFSSKYTFVKENISFSQMAQKLKVNSAPSVFIIQPKTRSSQKIKWECLRQRACFEETLQKY